jgi:hypothetical protein
MIGDADVSRCVGYHMCRGHGNGRADTYNYDCRYECSVCEEVTGLREPRRLALEKAAILIEEVRIHQDRELRFRDQERREEAP